MIGILVPRFCFQVFAFVSMIFRFIFWGCFLAAWQISICISLFARLDCGRSWVRTLVGSNLFRYARSIKEKDKQLVLLRIRIMCPSEATCLSKDCCFSELEL